MKSWTNSPACSADAEWPACSPAVPLPFSAFSFCAPGVQEARKKAAAQIVPVILIIVSFYSGNNLIMCCADGKCKYNPFECQLHFIEALVPASWLRHQKAGYFPFFISDKFHQWHEPGLPPKLVDRKS